MKSEIKFGTDGWRGVISRDFTFENVRWVSQTVIDYLKKEHLHGKGLVIGYDRRFLSKEYAQEVASVAAANGVKVFMGKNFVPTPAVSWAVKEKNAAGGIMVTASHNPPKYNGIKFKEAFGGSALPETTALIENMLEKRQQEGKEPLSGSFGDEVAKGNIIDYDPLESYLRAVRNFVDLDKIKGSGIRVAYDPMHGAGSGSIGAILDEIGIEVREIRGDDNPGFGGISPEPIDRNLEKLMKMVARENYDIGLATDGDADRIGAVDGEGKFFNSHRILTVLARHLIEERGMQGSIIKTVSGTAMIDHMSRKFGLKVEETPIGFKHICKKMLKGGVLLGGEESGGIGITSHLPERDGILVGLLLVEIMAVKGKGIYDVLEEVFHEFGPFHYDRIDVEIKKEEMATVRSLLESYHPQSIAGMKVKGENRMDGVKFLLGERSWLLIRASGTEPVLRIYAESDSPENVKKLLDEGKEAAGLRD
ncbi:MAG: phosphoglucomutase/phosphomannomutase family protein [Deltaproteobacteria bacterium]|nr:phosphoglucomutase/phosphomannomutase family protein [Deltaproteobacteria bacterium]